MSSRRVLKAAQAIREVVSMAIITDIKDPRVKDVTVTFVEVTGDMRMAKVHVSVMGDETKQKLCLKGLQSSVGYLQKKVGNRIDTRYTPRIQFQLDKGLQNAMSVTRILEEVLPAEEAKETESSDETTDDVSASDAVANSPEEETNPEFGDHV
jgi:ribosome-binding factor A